jgi:hypothetical protein
MQKVKTKTVFFILFLFCVFDFLYFCSRFVRLGSVKNQHEVGRLAEITLFTILNNVRNCRNSGPTV